MQQWRKFHQNVIFVSVALNTDVWHAHDVAFFFSEKACSSTKWEDYCQTSNISHTLVGNKVVDHSDVVESIACWRCSNYIFILDLTPGFIGLGKDNCKTRRQNLALGQIPICIWFLSESLFELYSNKGVFVFAFDWKWCICIWILGKKCIWPQPWKKHLSFGNWVCLVLEVWQYLCHW